MMYSFRKAKNVARALLCALAFSFIAPTVQAWTRARTRSAAEQATDENMFSPAELELLATSDAPCVLLGSSAMLLFKSVAAHTSDATPCLNACLERMNNEMIVVTYQEFVGGVSEAMGLISFSTFEEDKKDMLTQLTRQVMTGIQRGMLDISDYFDYVPGTASVELYLCQDARIFTNQVAPINPATGLGDMNFTTTLAGHFKVNKTAIVMEDATICGTTFTDAIDTKDNGVVAFLSDVCIDASKTLSVDQICPKSDGGQTLFCGNVTVAADKMLTVLGSFVIPGEVVISATNDVMLSPGQCVFTDCILPATPAGTTTIQHLAVVDGKELRVNKIVPVEPGFTGVANTGGLIQICGDLCIDATNTLSVDTIQPKTLGGSVLIPELTANNIDATGLINANDVDIAGDLCVVGNIQADRIEPKANDATSFISVCIDEGMTLSTDRICAKTDGGAIDVCTSLCMDATHTLSVDTIQRKTPGGSIFISDIFTNGIDVAGVINVEDICVIGGIQADRIEPKTNDATSFVSVWVDEGMTLSADRICAKTDGGAIDVCTSLCIDATHTLSVDTIQPKTPSGVVMIPNLMTDSGEVNGDFCVTGSIVADCFEAKTPGGAIEFKSSLCIDATHTLSVDTIQPKTPGGPVVVPTGIVKIGGGDEPNMSGCLDVGGGTANINPGKVTIGGGGSNEANNTGVLTVGGGPGECNTGSVTIGGSGAQNSGTLTVGGPEIDAEGTITIEGGPLGNEGLLTVNGDVCVTGTIRTDCLESKTTGTIVIKSNLCLDSTVTLSVDTILPKTLDRETFPGVAALGDINAGGKLDSSLPFSITRFHLGGREMGAFAEMYVGGRANDARGLLVVGGGECDDCDGEVRIGFSQGTDNSGRLRVGGGDGTSSGSNPASVFIGSDTGPGTLGALQIGGGSGGTNTASVVFAGGLASGNSASVNIGGGSGSSNSATLDIAGGSGSGNDATVNIAGGLGAGNSAVLNIAGSGGDGNIALVSMGGGIGSGNFASLDIAGGSGSGNSASVTMGGGLGLANTATVDIGGGSGDGNTAKVTIGGGLGLVNTATVDIGGGSGAGNTGEVTIGGGSGDDSIGILTVGGGPGGCNTGSVTVGGGGANNSGTLIVGGGVGNGGGGCLEVGSSIFGLSNAGSVTVHGGGGTDGRLRVDGNLICVTSSCPSDSRLKTDISSVDNEDILSKVLLLDLKTFKFNEDFINTPTVNQETMYGILGQNLKAVFPSVVDATITQTIGGTYYDDLHYVRFGMLGPIALGGIQALENRFSDSTRTTTFDAAVRVENDFEVIGGDIKLDGAVLHASDRRVKVDQGQLDACESLERILQLQPRSYKLTPEFAGVPLDEQSVQRGFYAQEVETVMPEVVSTMAVQRTLSDGQKETVLDDFKAINYTAMIVDTIAALQAEHERALTAEARIEALEQRLEEVAARFAAEA